MGFTPAATRVFVTGQPPMAGDIEIAAGANIGLTESSAARRIIAQSPTPGIPRSVELFVPGLLVAKTVAKLALPNAFLRRLDANLLTAPAAGVSGAACANVVVSGAVSGAVTLPLSTVGTADYHLGNGDLQSNVGSTGNFDTTENFPGRAMLFRANANLAILGFDIGGIAPGAGITNPGGGVVGRLRGGFASITSAAPPLPVAGSSIPAWTNNGPPWLLDTAGNPAFVDVPAASLAPNLRAMFIFPQPVNLLTGTDYYFVIDSPDYVLNTGGQQSNVNRNSGNTYSAAGSILSPHNGDSVNNWSIVHDYATGQWQSGFGNNVGLDMRLFASVLGTPVPGIVTVAITLTGAPGAAAGSDLNISATL